MICLTQYEKRESRWLEEIIKILHNSTCFTVEHQLRGEFTKKNLCPLTALFISTCCASCFSSGFAKGGMQSINSQKSELNNLKGAIPYLADEVLNCEECSMHLANFTETIQHWLGNANQTPKWLFKMQEVYSTILCIWIFARL